ncbi:MAG: transglutaminase TgpA family protein [Thermodesulfobacteriota bacterium]
MRQPTPLQAVVITLMLTYVPHMFWLPVWVSLFCLSLWSIRLLAEYKGWKPPGRLYLYALTGLALAGALIFRDGNFYGRDAGTCLLALMLAIKPFEMNTFRDQMITLFLGLFLLFTVILFEQNLLTGLYIFGCLILITAAFISLNQSRFQVLTTIGRAFLLFVQGLPLAVVCFVLFPRLPGALVGIQDQRPVNISGLSRTLRPGSLSKLVQSDTIVFRAKFQGPTPENKDLYWRAGVLWDYDDNAWSRITVPKSSPPLFEKKRKQKQYTVTLEPTRQLMLPALDLPLNTPGFARMEAGLTLRAGEEIRKRTEYLMTSSLDAVLSTPSPAQIRQGLQLDKTTNQRTRKLIHSLRKEQKGPKDLVARVLELFREDGFSYSLSPPSLDSVDPVDQFLFQTRTGYCAHFAQAFAWMMRCARIPARIVIGYQGGQRNRLGEYLIVRQKDAHAWVEIVLPGQGWTRIDPTRAVAPERIETGIQGLAFKTPEGPVFLIPQDHWIQKIGDKIRLGWDALNYKWHAWVLDYTFSRQNRLFSRLHLGQSAWQSLRKVILITTICFLLLSGILALVLLRPRKGGQDQVKRLYNRFLRKLNKSKIPVFAHEGPCDLSQRIALEYPLLQSRVREIIRLYIQLRYAGIKDKNLIQKLKKDIRRFRIQKQR